LFVLDFNVQQALVPLFTVPPGFHIAELAEIAPGRLRLITTPDTLGPVALTVVDIPIGGESSRLGIIAYLLQPQFGRGGAAIAGLAYPSGPLVIHNLETGQRVLLSNPASVSDFKWR
jgi:hypothetical protein